MTIDGNTVSITAETKREKEVKEGEKVLRSERYFGSMARSMTLPDDIDLDRAEAVFENGVLTLTLAQGTGRRVAQAADPLIARLSRRERAGPPGSPAGLVTNGLSPQRGRLAAGRRRRSRNDRGGGRPG